MWSKEAILIWGNKKKKQKSYVEKDLYSEVSDITSRDVYEGKYCRVFMGQPRIIPIQTSRPYWDIKDLTSPFTELASNVNHRIEYDASPEERVPIFAGRVCYQSFGSKAGRKTADDYINHIMEVGHYSILEHSSVTIYVDRVPRFWSHEQVRHRHFNYSQLSQRFFVPDKVELVIPPALRKEKNIEQEFLNYGEELGKKYFKNLDVLYSSIGSDSFSLKKKSREAARAILPECTETKMVITGNFRSWYEYLQKRNTPDADATFQEVAKIIELRLQRIAPNIFKETQNG